ncbi:MAG TPA: adenylate kinase [Actinomycetota bacterium]|nr:adenylate kinase [Actinomycetota bacterium]
MRMVIFGPQGAGKGTQGALISEKLGIPSIATGEIFRWAISGETSLGHKVQEYVESGRLVPDELTIEIVRERLLADDCVNGWLLDGFPRNVSQARALDDIVAEAGASLDAALMIEVPEEESLRRIMGRRVCLQCGRNYHVDSPPANDWKCDRCGGDVVARRDDTEESVRTRLRLYHEQTEPLKAYYEERGLLRAVDGLGTPEAVFARVMEML